MEYCAVRGAFNPLLDAHTQQFDVHKDVARGVMIAAHHDAYVEKDREGTDPVHKLFNLRAKFLVTYVLEALGTKPSAEDIKPALEAAFQRIDEQVKLLAEELKFNWPAVFLETKFNSVVVIVHDGWVYTAGDSDVLIFLARKSEPFYLTSDNHQLNRFAVINRQKNSSCGSDEIPSYGSDEPILFYFHQERLQPDLVIGSSQIWHYIRQQPYMLPILQSRIDVEGLKETCKSIVGPFIDRSKILIVITLQKDAHKAKGSLKRPRLDDSMLEELLNTEWLDIDDPKDRVKRDPLCYLLPYVNGRKQDPVPQTSSDYYAFHYIQEPCAEDKIEISSSL